MTRPDDLRLVARLALETEHRTAAEQRARRQDDREAVAAANAPPPPPDELADRRGA